jgi:hypothetical protein
MPHLSPTFRMYQLPSDLNLSLDSQDVQAVLESVGFPKRWRYQITGAMTRIHEGEYLVVFLSEDRRVGSNDSLWHPLPFYMHETPTQPATGRDVPEYRLPHGTWGTNAPQPSGV